VNCGPDSIPEPVRAPMVTGCGSCVVVVGVAVAEGLVAAGARAGGVVVGAVEGPAATEADRPPASTTGVSEDVVALIHADSRCVREAVRPDRTIPLCTTPYALLLMHYSLCTDSGWVMQTSIDE
jgi:hypothetical protein